MDVFMGFKVSRTLQKLDCFSGWNRKLVIPGMNECVSVFLLYKKINQTKNSLLSHFPKQLTIPFICSSLSQNSDLSLVSVSNASPLFLS